MFRRVALNRIRSVEASLGQFEWDSRRDDHASSGPCDKSPLATSYTPTPSDEGQEVYTLVCPRGTNEVHYYKDGKELKSTG